MSQLPGKFVWFEHVSPDTAKARTFYEALFGWHVENMPLGSQTYSMIQNGSDGIGGLLPAPAGTPARWAAYVSVPDVDAAHASALACGAKSVAAPADLGPIGRSATVTDPTGAVVCLWKSAQGDPPDPQRTPEGAWLWNELWTPDASTALAFYERVVGYSHDAMDMGPNGTYYLLKSADGKMRGGLMQGSADCQTRPMWLPYVRVADCDASADKAKGLGAQVAMGPRDIPEVGRFSVLIDPQGAALAVMKPTPQWDAPR
jgi:predicted enzyme related to lactoylglutathione lyase